MPAGATVTWVSHRIGNEAFAVSLVLQPFQIGGRRLFVAAKNDFRPQFNARYGKFSLSVLFKVAYGVVLIGIDDESFM